MKTLRNQETAMFSKTRKFIWTKMEEKPLRIGGGKTEGTADADFRGDRGTLHHTAADHHYARENGAYRRFLLFQFQHVFC